MSAAAAAAGEANRLRYLCHKRRQIRNCTSHSSSDADSDSAAAAAVEAAVMRIIEDRELRHIRSSEEEKSGKRRQSSRSREKIDSRSDHRKERRREADKRRELKK